MKTDFDKYKELLESAIYENCGKYYIGGKVLQKVLDMHKRKLKILNMPIVTHSAYQLCPKCNGQGIVSKPPWVAGDINEWTSSAASYVCDLCNGAKVIPQHCG